jgi:hypothetical protein
LLINYNIFFNLKLVSDISKLFKLSPLNAIKKIAEVIKRHTTNWFDRRSDLNTCTYSRRPDWFKGITHNTYCLHEKDFLKKHKNEIIALADKYLDHEFDLLGSGWVKVNYGLKAQGVEGFVFLPSDLSSAVINSNNQERSDQVFNLLTKDYSLIDWQIDFKSGYRWKDDQWYKDIKYGQITGPDIKVPWEIGRMQHLVILAYAAAFSNENKCDTENKYCFEIRNQILDFIASNPPRFGVQWMSNMDVAIRLANWLYVYDVLISFNVQFEEEFINIFHDSIYDHFSFILNNFEHSVGMKANHYFANIIGLLFAVAHLPENEETTNILNFAINELINETYNQFYEDGANFEQSTYYHVFVTEMLLHGMMQIKLLSPEKIIALNLLNNKKLYKIDKDCLFIIFPDDFNERLTKIMGFANSVESEGGNISRIGDDDGGYFLAHIYKQFALLNNYRDICNLIHINNIYESLDKDYILQNSKKRTISYPDFGLYIKHGSNFKFIFRCGGIGQNGKGGHSHNDQLSFVLSINDLEFIVDPGTYLYTPIHKRRNEFRSVRSHNTMIFGDLEQNLWDTASKDDLFWILKERTKSELIEFSEKKFIGKHFAYPQPHIRNIEFNANKITCIDTCQANGNKKVAFHFHPEAEINGQDDKITIKRQNFLCTISTLCNYQINDYDYSSSYGLLEKAKVLHIISEKNEIEWKLEILI